MADAQSAPHLIVGESHEHSSPKKFVNDMLTNHEFTVLFIEHIDFRKRKYFENDCNKEFLTKWLEKTPFEVINEWKRLDSKGLSDSDSDNDTPSSDDRAGMLKIIQHLNKYDDLRGNKSAETNNTFAGMIRLALEKNIIIIPIDRQDIYYSPISGPVKGEERVKKFNKHASEVITEYLKNNEGCRSVALVGSTHAARSYSNNEKQNGAAYPLITSMGELLDIPTILVSDRVSDEGSECKEGDGGGFVAPEGAYIQSSALINGNGVFHAAQDTYSKPSALINGNGVFHAAQDTYSKPSADLNRDLDFRTSSSIVSKGFVPTSTVSSVNVVTRGDNVDNSR